jgi:hypothetical protein
MIADHLGCTGLRHGAAGRRRGRAAIGQSALAGRRALAYIVGAPHGGRSMRNPFVSNAAALIGLVSLAASPQPALAWGATGHRLIGELAVEALPADLPAFLHTKTAAETAGEIAREPDRWRSAGKVHDAMRDPAHFINVDDNGRAYGGPLLAALPPTREEYEAQVRAASPYKGPIGYLPYAIVDGWEQLTKDFAYWRVLTAAIPREKNLAHKAWMKRDLARREMLTLHDLGDWAHYVGDASQPMHVSIHYDGWGPFPNPNGYTLDRVHASFEGAFVRQNVGAEQIRAAMAPPKACADPIEACTARYLAETLASVDPFYALQKAGGFKDGDARGRAFAAARLAAGADELRDLIVSAWAASAKSTVGYPPLSVSQVVDQGADPFDPIYGED